MKRIVWIVLAAVVASIAPARADIWPSKPIHIVVTFAPGGAADIWARILADHLSTALRQSVVVENRGGGGGIVGATQVARADPDGTTFLIGGLAPQILAPAIAGNAPFDAMRDFEHIAYIGGPPIVLVVPPASELHSVADVVKAAKADKLSGYASSGVGTLGHLVVEYVAKQEGLKLTHIPYNTAAFADILAGRVPLGSFTWGAALGPGASRHVARARRHDRDAAARGAGRADLQGVRLRSRRQHLVLAGGAEGHAEGDRRAPQHGNRPHSRHA